MATEAPIASRQGPGHAQSKDGIHGRRSRGLRGTGINSNLHALVPASPRGTLTRGPPIGCFSWRSRIGPHRDGADRMGQSRREGWRWAWLHPAAASSPGNGRLAERGGGRPPGRVLCRCLRRTSAEPAPASSAALPAMRPPAPATLGLLLLPLLMLPGEADKKPTPCQSCRELVDKFHQGMVDTAKKNFGGGNTAWEEKTLSKYESSEVRLLEILERLCGSSDFECNRMLEEHEEQLEAWWLRLKKDYPDLFEWFCVKTLKFCCSPGTYGPDCLACQGGPKRPCSGNGRCSGDGSRQGDGSCQCHMGYKGALCTDCVDGYFSSLRNETHSICTACDESCKTCTGPTNRDCNQCEGGWVLEGDACLDVDECAAETPPCELSQFCKNINGSYYCEECDSTCVGCTGKGPEQCKDCIPGYTKENGQCTDIDECSLEEKACMRKGENCYNTPGSFVCVCPDGFEETEDACVKTEVQGDEESPTQAPSHEDL